MQRTITRKQAESIAAKIEIARHMLTQVECTCPAEGPKCPVCQAFAELGTVATEFKQRCF